MTIGAGKLIGFAIIEQLNPEYSSEMKGWAIINPKYQIIRSHPTPCGTVTHFFDNNILCHSICTPKSAMMSLISSLKSCFPSFFFFLLQMTLNTTMFAVSHFFGLSAERQHKIFSLCDSLKYILYSPQLSDLLVRIYRPSGLQHHQCVQGYLLAKNCLYCDWQLSSEKVRAF